MIAKPLLFFHCTCTKQMNPTCDAACQRSFTGRMLHFATSTVSWFTSSPQATIKAILRGDVFLWEYIFVNVQLCIQLWVADMQYDLETLVCCSLFSFRTFFLLIIVHSSLFQFASLFSVKKKKNVIRIVVYYSRLRALSLTHVLNRFSLPSQEPLVLKEGNMWAPSWDDHTHNASVGIQTLVLWTAL